MCKPLSGILPFSPSKGRVSPDQGRRVTHTRKTPLLRSGRVMGPRRSGKGLSRKPGATTSGMAQGKGGPPSIPNLKTQSKHHGSFQGNPKENVGNWYASFPNVFFVIHRWRHCSMYFIWLIPDAYSFSSTTIIL